MQQTSQNELEARPGRTSTRSRDEGPRPSDALSEALRPDVEGSESSRVEAGFDPSGGAGNSLVAQALSGAELGGFGDAVLTGVAAQVCGLSDAMPMASNAAMQRLMRHAEEVAPGQHISMARLGSLMAASTGGPLPAAIARRLGDVLGHDFSRVRIHTDSAAMIASRGISARAFTTGHDIYFGSGQYRPGTPAGDELLAHELTHVIQHDEGRLRGGGISSPTDAIEKEAVASGRSAITRLALAARMPEEENQPASELDTAQARRTEHLVRELVRALGLPAGSVAVRMDEEAAKATEAHGTRGLMKGGEVLLHPDRFDPTVADGRALLAHELVHVAQQGLAPAEGAGAGQLAEAEAHLFASAFAGGGAMPDVAHGLPAGHVAAEGNVSGDALRQLIAQQRGTAETNSSGITTPEPTPNNVGDAGTESHERKVSRYQDGVDGIADEIGGLEAFDQLCEAIDDEEDTGPALTAIRGTEAYQRLCDMWQGAKEGGVDRPAMEAAFNSEFDDRGFWGSTEQAFDLVEAAAKRDARPRPEAEAARARQAEAQANAGNAAQEQVPGEGQGEGTEGGNLANGGGQASLPPGVDPALLDASVTQAAPDLPAFNQMQQVQDSELTEIQTLLNHRQGLASEMGSMQLDDRLGQVSEAFWDGFAGSFASSFTDQAFDTLVLDTLGSLADKGLTVATRGAFRVPFVGPLIGLAMTKPWEANSLGEWAGNAFGTNDMGKGASALWNADWTSGWEHVDSAGDFIGVLCDKFADLFEGLRDIVKGLATLAGTLSALSYIAGGILIGVGLALVWLAGVGAPLITAGTWLVNAGTILGRVATALGLIGLGLSLLGAVFRAAAAFLVPSEMYAEQLAGVGTAASAFGDATGAKVGDVSASHARDAATARFSPRGGDASPQGGDEGQSGRTDAQAADRRIQQEEAGIRQVREDVQASMDEAARSQTEGQTPRQDDPDSAGPDSAGPDSAGPDSARRQQDGDEGPDARQRLGNWGRDVARVFNPVHNIRRGLTETIDSIREARHAIQQPGQAAAEALDPRSRQMIEERLRQHEERLRTQTDQLTERIRQVQGWVDHLNLTPARARELRIQLLAMKAQLAVLDTQLNGIRGHGGVASSNRHMEGQRANHERADRLRADVDQQGDGVRDRYDQLKGEKKSLEGENRRIDRDVRQKQEDLEAARRARQEAETAEADLARQAREHDAAQEPYRQAKRNDDEAGRLLTEQMSQRQRATQLEQEAQAIRSARDIDTELGPRREQLSEMDQTIQRSDGTIDRDFAGEMLQMPDHPYGPQLAVMGMGPNGLRVADAGTTEHVLSPAEIPDPRLRALVEENMRLRSEAEPVRQEVQTLEDRRQETLRGAGLDEQATTRDPASMEDEARGLRQSANELQPQLDAAQAGSTHNGHSDVPPHMRERTQEIERQQRERQQARQGASDRITALEAEIQSLGEQRRGNEQRLGELEQEIARQRDILAMQEQEGLARRDWDFGGASSGNATGGVGSAYKEAFAFLWESFLSKEQQAGSQPTTAPTPEDEEQAKTNGLGSMLVNNVDGLQNWKDEGLSARYQAHWQAIGDEQADVEQLLELYPPVQFEELAEERRAAVAAQERYAIAHAEAYKAYVAEQRVTSLAAETEALAQSGQPLQQESQRQAAPLQQSVVDEQQRASTLGGGNTRVGEDEGEGGGIVMELIGLLAENADSFDSQPQAGDSSAGSAIGSASTDSNEAATQRMGQATGGSDQQRAFLDQAIALRTQQEADISGNICSLETKHAEELSILDEIKRVKAQRLSEREAARAETEDHATTFNTGVEQIRGWADQYRARRETLGR